MVHRKSKNHIIQNAQNETTNHSKTKKLILVNGNHETICDITNILSGKGYDYVCSTNPEYLLRYDKEAGLVLFENYHSHIISELRKQNAELPIYLIREANITADECKKLGVDGAIYKGKNHKILNHLGLIRTIEKYLL